MVQSHPCVSACVTPAVGRETPDGGESSRTIKFYGANAAGEMMEADIPEGCAVLGAGQTFDGSTAAAPIEWVNFGTETLQRRGADPQLFPEKWIRHSKIQWRPCSAIDHVITPSDITEAA